ncbi:MAG: methyltransferase domain-containing protein [Phycisphaerales bacterium]
MAKRLDRASLSLRSRSLYPSVLAYFAEARRDARAGLRVLDVPAGSGVLSFPLRAAGYDVTSADLFPEYLEEAAKKRHGEPVVSAFEDETGARLPTWLRLALYDDAGEGPEREGDVACVAADMEARLPFEDGSFDVVLCVEGIEHVVDRHKTLKELRRVLRPGGRMLITTPNLLSLRARLAYMFAGQRAFNSYIDEHTSVWGKSADGTRTYHGHAFLISYYQLRYSLHHCGFRMTRLVNSNWSPTSVLLSPLALGVWWGTWRSQRSAKRKFERLRREGKVGEGAQVPYGEMLGHVMTRAMLFGATLICEAEAVEGSV